MNDEPVYRVVVTREEGAWLADVPELAGAHTYARTLPALDRAVREAVVLAADRPDEDMPVLRLAFDYPTGDPDVDRGSGPLMSRGRRTRTTGSPTRRYPRLSWTSQSSISSWSARASSA